MFVSGCRLFWSAKKFVNDRIFSKSEKNLKNLVGSDTQKSEQVISIFKMTDNC